MSTRLGVVVVSLWILGCGSSPGGDPPDAPVAIDARDSSDAAAVDDAALDDAALDDAAVDDAAVDDAAASDAAASDAAGTADGAEPDATSPGPADAAATDAAPADGAAPDAATPADARPPDASPPDASPPDASPADARPPDAGPADASLPDARTGPCTVAPTGPVCLDCLLDVAQDCAGPCVDEGAALVTCGVLRGCCTGTSCDPACLQRACPTQWQAVIDCAIDSCGDDIAVCF